MCLGLAGSRATASKSITPSKAPLVRIHSLTAWPLRLLGLVVVAEQRRCRANVSSNGVRVAPMIRIVGGVGAGDQLPVAGDDVVRRRRGLTLGHQDRARGQPMSLMPIIRMTVSACGWLEHIAVEAGQGVVAHAVAQHRRRHRRCPRSAPPPRPPAATRRSARKSGQRWLASTRVARVAPGSEIEIAESDDHGRGIAGLVDHDPAQEDARRGGQGGGEVDSGKMVRAAAFSSFEAASKQRRY